MAKFIGKVETTDIDGVAVDLLHLGTVVSGDEYTHLLNEDEVSGKTEYKIKDIFLPESIGSGAYFDESGNVKTDISELDPEVASGNVSVSGTFAFVDKFVEKILEPYKEALDNAIMPKVDITNIYRDKEETASEQPYYEYVHFGDELVFSGFDFTVSTTKNSDTLSYSYAFGGVTGTGELEQATVPQTVGVFPEGGVSVMPELRKWNSISASVEYPFRAGIVVRDSDERFYMGCHYAYYGNMDIDEIYPIEMFDWSYFSADCSSNVLVTDKGGKFDITTENGKRVCIFVAEDDYGTGEGFKINQGGIYSIDDELADYQDSGFKYIGRVEIEEGVVYRIYISGLQKGGDDFRFKVVPGNNRN